MRSEQAQFGDYNNYYIRNGHVKKITWANQF